MKDVKRSWITTVFGILMLLMAAVKIYQNPACATDPQTIALIGGGAGLIAATDANKTGTAGQEQAK